MSAAALLDDLSRAGLRLERRGDRLHVEGPRGTVTPELRLILTERKAELLAVLDTRTRLLDIADAELIDAVLVHRLPQGEIDQCEGLPSETLRAYVRALHDNDLRRRLKVPPDETARALCASCGPVWVAQTIVAVAPVVAGWARIAGCPWCHLRRAGARIPRPPVTCGECVHFMRDKINPSDGMGRCGVGCDPDRSWPNAKQDCGTFRPIPSERLTNPNSESLEQDLLKF